MKHNYLSNHSFAPPPDASPALLSDQSLPRSNRSAAVPLLTDEPTPTAGLIGLEQFEDLDLASPTGTQDIEIMSPPPWGAPPGGSKLTMMDRLQQNYAKMRELLEGGGLGLGPLKRDYSMDELCYLLMDHCELLVARLEETAQRGEPEYLSTLNRKLMAQVSQLKDQLKRQEGATTRAAIQTEYLEKQLQGAHRQAREYKTLLGRSGVDLDRRLADLERKDKDELRSLRFLKEELEGKVALREQELSRARDDLSRAASQADEQRERAAFLAKLEQQQEYIAHLETRLKDVIAASRLEFPLYSGQPPPAHAQAGAPLRELLGDGHLEADALMQMLGTQAAALEEHMKHQPVVSEPGRLTLGAAIEEADEGTARGQGEVEYERMLAERGAL